MADADVRSFIGVNRWHGVLWFNKQAFEELLRWMAAIAAITTGADPALTDDEKAEHLSAQQAIIGGLHRAMAESEYQVEKLLAAVKG